MIICQIRKRVNGPKSELYLGVVAVACPNTLESIPALRPSGTGSTDTGNYQWCSESCTYYSAIASYCCRVRW